MGLRLRLLKCIGKAVAKHGVRFVMNLVPGGDVVYDIAADTWEEYQRDGQHGELLAEVEALAQAAPAELRSAVYETVEEAARDQAADVREAMTNYLIQVPAAIRRSLRRPSDPSGTTLRPIDTLRRADDLIQFLPQRPPRFKPGDRPVPGVDLELEELVGIGGFGEVWKARNPNMRNKAPVALKFCLDKSAIAALRNEVGVLDHVMKQGRHPGIVPLLQTYLSADPPFLEYEFVEGGDLAGLIQEMHARGRVKCEVANRVVLRLADIVAFAHRASPPIVHGDLKPANILVRRHAGGKVALRITDFGIGGLAAALSAEQQQPSSCSRPQLLTQAVRGAYTPLYASPQQRTRRPGEVADPRDDIHALGVIWYQLLTGDLALTSIPTDWREQTSERGLSDALIDLLGRCFSPKPDKRPDNAIVLAEQLGVLLAVARNESAAAKEAAPKVEDGFVVLQLADEPAGPLRPATSTHKPARTAHTRQSESVGTLRHPAETRAPAEMKNRVPVVGNAIGNLAFGAGAFFLLFSLVAVVGVGIKFLLFSSPPSGEVTETQASTHEDSRVLSQPQTETPADRDKKPAADDRLAKQTEAEQVRQAEAAKIAAATKQREEAALAGLKRCAGSQNIFHNEEVGGRPVYKIHLSGSRVYDDDFKLLAQFKGLKILDLSGGEIRSGAGFAYLKDLTNLESISLYDCAKVTFKSLSVLKDVKALTTLTLHACGVRDADLAAIGALKNLSMLILSSNPGISDAGIKELRGLRNLTWLDIQGTNVSIDGVPFLIELKSLEQLNVAFTPLSRSKTAMAALATGLPNLGKKGK